MKEESLCSGFVGVDLGVSTSQLFLKRLLLNVSIGYTQLKKERKPEWSLKPLGSTKRGVQRVSLAFLFKDSPSLEMFFTLELVLWT